MNLNKVMLGGNLTRDPEKRYLPNGTATSSFTIAINKVWTDNGEKKEKTTFIKIVTWNKLAEICAEYLAKGSSVFVEGELNSRSYDDKEGKKVYVTEVVANNVQFLSKPKEKAAEPAEKTEFDPNDFESVGPDSGQVPF